MTPLCNESYGKMRLEVTQIVQSKSCTSCFVDRTHCLCVISRNFTGKLLQLSLIFQASSECQILQKWTTLFLWWFSAARIFWDTGGASYLLVGIISILCGYHNVDNECMDVFGELWWTNMRFWNAFLVGCTFLLVILSWGDVIVWFTVENVVE